MQDVQHALGDDGTGYLDERSQSLLLGSPGTNLKFVQRDEDLRQIVFPMAGCRRVWGVPESDISPHFGIKRFFIA